MSETPTPQLIPTISDLEEASHVVNSDNDILFMVAVCQAILESRKGKSWSNLALRYNNWFGIKGSGTAGSVNLKTREVIKGKDIKVTAGFSVNNNIIESFQQHRALMNKNRYKAVREAVDLVHAFSALKSCGYATDGQYAKLLTAIAKRQGYLS